MLSPKHNILQLVALLHEHGIQDVVLCPGSRNAPIVHTISQSALFRCHAITDERSAGFFAIGLSLASGLPTAVVVTSGSALVNLHPAVAEAFYQQVPLVVISADRPLAWIGQMDGQTMPQPDALGKTVRLSVNLPETHTPEDEWHVNRLVNEALLECTHRGQGPVHINVPLSEPLYDFTVSDLPEVRVIQRIEGLSPASVRKIAKLLSLSNHRMIIVGQKSTDRSLQHPYLAELDQGFVTLCEHLANLGPGHVALTNPEGLVQAIPQGQADQYAPDLVITIGGHVVSKSLKKFLRKHPPRQHWHVSPNGQVSDLFQCLTCVIEAHPALFLETLAYLMIGQTTTPEFPLRWKALVPAMPSQSAENQLVGSLFQAINTRPVGEPAPVIHLANSSAVRLAQQFCLDPTVTVCCNRGINGIEGSLSAAVGFATATPKRINYVLVGDLSFFYDQNAFWNTQLPQNLRILLLNSGGGKIFQTLPIPQEPESQRFICGRQHFTARNLCLHYGLPYLEIGNIDEWNQALPRFTQPEVGNLLIEFSPQ